MKSFLSQNLHIFREGGGRLGNKSLKNLYIFREGGGRLRNQLYWFASTYGIARHHGRKNLWGMKMKEHLFNLFPGKFSSQDHFITILIF